MSTYLDTSVLMSLLVEDANSSRAKRLTVDDVIVSDLTSAEFASALAIRFRRGSMSEDEVRAAHRLFDIWRRANAESVDVLSADLRRAEAIIRTLNHSLKTADATHLAIADRLGAALATFDTTMARESQRLGIALAPP